MYIRLRRILKHGNILLKKCLNTGQPIFIFPERALSRWFLKKNGTRQSVDVTGTAGIRFVGQCAVKCIEKAQQCVGFNFKHGPVVMYELCGVPHDAPNADMLVNSDWDHYAVIS